MTTTKQFLLKNLLKLRDLRGEVDEERLSNLVEAFRDELYHLRDSDEISQNYEAGTPRREEAFDNWAKDKILSINQ